jgi:hypothetical protein
MDNQNNKSRNVDFGPKLEESTRTQYGMAIAMCAAVILVVLSFGAVVAYTNWSAILRAFS